MARVVVVVVLVVVVVAVAASASAFTTSALQGTQAYSAEELRALRAAVADSEARLARARLRLRDAQRCARRGGFVDADVAHAGGNWSSLVDKQTDTCDGSGLEPELRGALLCGLGEARSIIGIGTDDVVAPSTMATATNVLVFLMHNPTNYTELATEIGQMSSLGYLYGLQAFKGAIPTQIGNLKDTLTLLILQRCDVTGTVPSQLGLLTNLLALSIGYAPLTGTLPSQLGNLHAIQKLELHDLRVGGTIPSQFARLGSLLSVRLETGRLSGLVPHFLFAPSLNSLEVANHNFHGSLPSEVGLMSELTTLSLYSTTLNQGVPTEIGLATKLGTLRLSSSHLSGSLPSQIGRLQHLSRLEVFDNQITGTVPQELARLTALTRVFISHNDLSGSLPSPLPSSLQALDCDYSGLSDARCAEDCGTCAFSSIEVRGCNDRGKRQLCLPMYYVTPVLVVIFVVLVIAYVRLHRGKKRSFVLHAIALAGVGLLAFVLSVAFAALVGGMVGAVSAIASMATVASGTIICMRVIPMIAASRAAGDSDADSARFALVVATAVCLAGIRSLRFVLLPPQRLQVLRLRTGISILALCLQDLPQTIALSIALVQGHHGLEVVLALAFVLVCLAYDAGMLVRVGVELGWEKVKHEGKALVGLAK